MDASWAAWCFQRDLRRLGVRLRVSSQEGRRRGRLAGQRGGIDGRRRAASAADPGDGQHDRDEGHQQDGQRGGGDERVAARDVSRTAQALCAGGSSSGGSPSGSGSRRGAARAGGAAARPADRRREARQMRLAARSRLRSRPASSNAASRRNTITETLSRAPRFVGDLNQRVHRALRRERGDRQLDLTRGDVRVRRRCTARHGRGGARGLR